MGTLPRPTIEYNPQQNDPLSAIEKVTSLRSMLQGQQLQQQQIQAAQLENQQRQMAVRDQQVVRDAFVKNGGDPDKTLQDAARAGVSPATLQQLQLHAADLKTKNLALINAQGEKALRDADLMKGAYDTLVKTPPEQRPQVYPQLVNGLKQAQVDVSQLSPQYPGDDHLPILGALIQGHSKGIEEAAKQAGISKDQATAAKDQAETTKTQLETSVMQQFGGMSPQLADSKYRFLQSRLSAKQPISADDQAFIKGYEKQKLLVPQTTAQIRVEGMGKIRQFPVFDNQTKQTVYMDSNEINDAKLREPDRFTVPSFTPEAEIEKQTGKTFGPGGKGSEEVLAFGTALAHADLLKQTAAALKNGDTQALNSLKNKWNQQFGSAVPTNAQAIANVYAREVTKAVSAGHITDSEIRDQGATIDPNKMSPAQIEGAMDTYKALMQSKMNLRKQQFEAGKKGGTTFQQGASGTIFARDPQGKLHQAPAGTPLPAGWKQENK